MPLPFAEKSAIVILGAPSGGVDRLAQLLNLCGYVLPVRPTAPPALPGRPGAGRIHDIASLHDYLLGELGASWDRPGPYMSAGLGMAQTREELAAALVRHHAAQAAKLLREVYGEVPRIVLSADPAAGAVFWPLWKEALKLAGYAPQAVLLHRHPLSVAATLGQERKLAAVRALRLWLSSMIEALRLEQSGELHWVLAFEDLQRDPVTALGKLGAVLPQPLNAASREVAELLVAEGVAAGSSSLENSPVISKLLRQTYRLLQQWDSRARAERLGEIEQLVDSFDDAMLTSAAFIWLPGKILAATAEDAADSSVSGAAEAQSQQPQNRAVAPSIVAVAAAPRVVIVHYHLFKNAGTSVDAILKRNFGERWAELEFDTPQHKANVGDLTRWLLDHPHIAALSSHTALLPLPRVEGLLVLPIVFVRHPIERLHSAYGFERKQKADTVGARLAKAHDFATYLRTRLATRGDGSFRNFQANRLALAVEGDSTPAGDRALRAVEELPFVGLVEAFDASMQRFAELASSHFPEFKHFSARENVTAEHGKSPEEKLAVIRKEMGEELYKELQIVNHDDLQLFAAVCRKYGHPA
jgi:hypothetical protein